MASQGLRGQSNGLDFLGDVLRADFSDVYFSLGMNIRIGADYEH